MSYLEEPKSAKPVVCWQPTRRQSRLSRMDRGALVVLAIGVILFTIPIVYTYMMRRGV